MGADSKIQWTDATFNPWIGCQKVSPGCKHCYAAENTFVRIQRKEDRELWGPPATSERHVTSDANWRKPLAWDRKAQRRGEPALVFCASLADVFEDNPVLVDPRLRLFELIEATPNLIWQLLTKRPENVMDMIPLPWRSSLPENVWVGTSVENQVAGHERIEALAAVPARVRFLSCEPLLGGVSLYPWLNQRPDEWRGLLHRSAIQWVIVGGESGPDARPLDVWWVRSLVHECQVAGVSAFVKQLGSNVRDPAATSAAHYEHDVCWPRGTETDGHAIHLKDRKGGDPSEWPEDLRVRQMP